MKIWHPEVLQHASNLSLNSSSPILSCLFLEKASSSCYFAKWPPSCPYSRNSPPLSSCHVSSPIQKVSIEHVMLHSLNTVIYYCTELYMYMFYYYSHLLLHCTVHVLLLLPSTTALHCTCTATTVIYYCTALHMYCYYCHLLLHCTAHVLLLLSSATALHCTT